MSQVLAAGGSQGFFEASPWASANGYSCRRRPPYNRIAPYDRYNTAPVSPKPNIPR